MNKRRITVNLVVFVLFEILQKLSPLIVYAYAKSKLGLEAFGFSQFAMILVDSTVPFIVFGYSIVGAIEVGKVQDDPTKVRGLVASFTLLRLIHAVVSTLVLFAVIRAIPSWHQYTFVTACLLFFVFTSAIEMTYVLIATQRMLYLTFATGMTKLASLVAVLSFINRPEDATLYAIVSLGANSFASCFSVWVVWRTFGLRLRSIFKIEHLKPIFQKSLVPGTVAILFALSDRYDVYVARALFSDEKIGVYIGCLRVVRAFAPFMFGISSVFFSEMVGLKDPQSLSKHFRMGLSALLALTLPAAILSIVLGNDLLLWMYGSDFNGAGWVFSWLTWNIVAQVFWICYLQQLLVIKEEGARIVIYTIVGLVIGLAASTMSGMQYGLAGVAFGIFIGNAITGGLGFMRGQKHVTVPILREIFEAGIPALVAAAVVTQMPQVSIWLRVVASIVIFFGLYFAISRNGRKVFQIILKRGG